MSRNRSVIIKKDGMIKMYKENDIVEGKITGIEDYGIFVSLDNDYSGLIHISEISNGFVKNVHDYVSLGEVIKVRVVEVDEENKRLKLSIKNLNYNDDELQFIEETTQGFKSLKDNLKPWMEEKLAEYKED